MPGATASGYLSGRFALELEGTLVGFATSVDGGAIAGQVAKNDQGTPPVARKSISGTDNEPIVIEVGADIGPEVFAWIDATLQNTQPRRDGRVIFLDYQYTSRGELAWTDGLLTEIRFPELDAALSKDPVSIRLTITANTITRSAGGPGGQPFKGYGAGKSKSLNASNFRLSIAGMSQAPGYASWIGPITVRQAYVAPVSPGSGGAAATVGSLDVSDLNVAVSENRAGELYAWHQAHVIQDQNDERTGRIELLDASLKQPVFALDLTGLGIYRISPERRVTGAQSVARARADIYCEEVAFQAVQAAATTPATTGTTPSTPPTAPTAPADPTAAGLDLVTALRAALLGADAAGSMRADTLDPSAVAARLLRSTDVVRAEPDAAGDGRSADGRRIGADWARARATLQELEELAAAAGDEWDAITLRPDHSLVALLQKYALIDGDRAGDVVLARDPFVEGVVEGAAEVYAEVRPLVRERRERPEPA